MSGDVIEGTALARSGSASPLPVFSGKQMAEALVAYQQLQHALDTSMPDQIMDLDGKKFRKKGYWRAVAVAFNITVETLDERREIAGVFKDGRPNFGYVISKRATAPNGRSVVSDGTCFAVEKARRFKCPHPHPSWKGKTAHFPHATCPDFDPEFQWRTLPGDATEHNVRGHASTRAFNRAVSDLVGFGEVSAEEVEREEHDTAVEASKMRETSTSEPVTTRATQPTTAAAPGVTTVKRVEVKKGQNKKGGWTKYWVTFDDGRDGSTFSDTVGQELQAAAKAEPKTPVNPDLVKTDDGKYWNIKGLLPLVQASTAPAAEDVHHPEEPVSGPEKILVVRPVSTPHGDRWIIQTDKRELVTEKEADAEAARKARDEKLGIVPEFDSVPSPVNPKKMVNKLKALNVQAAAAREPGQEG